MFVWVLTVLAVASAAPQLQLQQPLRSQVISSSQPLSGQIITSQQPYTAQIYTSGQPITGQIISSHQIPLAQNYQQVPLNLQTVHSVTPQPITYQNVPLNVQTVQSVTPQPINYNVQSVTPQPINYNVQSIPVNTLNTVSIQPAQRVRVAQVKPVVRTQTIRPAQQIIATTASPLNIQTVQAVQPVQHIVSTPQVQHHIVATPQVQHVVSAPQVQHLVSAPQVRTVQLQQQQLQGVAILRQVQDVQPDGHYTFAFETENGIKAQEEGRIQSNGAEEINVVQGSYSYTAPDGTPISVNYVADENGFRAEGEHIPKPSEAILRSLEYLRSLPDRPEDQEGRYVRDQNGY